MRAFVALEVADPAVLDALVAYQRELAAAGADLKPVERQNLHFTLKFLGEIPPASAADADARLRRLALPGATVDVFGVGAFPSASRPNVVWVGVAKPDDDAVMAIARPVIAALDGIGESDRRPFRPHLTIARVRSDRNRGRLAEELARGSQRDFGRARLVSVKLKSSVLRPEGPQYSDVGAYELK